MGRWLIALTLAACSSPDVEVPPQDAGAAETTPAKASQERDDGPCGRQGTIVLPDGRVMGYGLPCRPYDRVRDLPRPADKVPESGR